MFTQLPNSGALLHLMYCFHLDLGMMGFKQRHVQESSSLQTSIMFFSVPPKAGQLLGLPTRAFAEAFQQDNVRFGSRQLQVECPSAQLHRGNFQIRRQQLHLQAAVQWGRSAAQNAACQEPCLHVIWSLAVSLQPVKANEKPRRKQRAGKPGAAACSCQAPQCSGFI